MKFRSLLAAIAASVLAAPSAALADMPPGPAAVLAAAPDGDWAEIAPDDLLVIDLARGGRVVIALAPGFAPVHIANIRAMASAHWYDGLVIERVQDNYVVQWGDPDGKKPLPAGVVSPSPAEYTRPATGVTFEPLPYPDTFAPAVGISAAFPAAEGGGEAWLAHCYGMVGVGRDLTPDTGTGAELYAVIGQSPRQLDRNIALVGRVVAGMEVLSALPRGAGDMGFYGDPGQRVAIRQVRLAADLPPTDRPHIQVLKAGSDSYRAWVKVKANRQDAFYSRPAAALDLCNALPPVRGK
jgi:cyclophilin family peptidyl-prolyl cis-trans isomerase